MNRLKHLKETRGAKEAAMSAIMTKCDDEKRSRTKEERTQWETLRDEVDAMKAEIDALEEQQAIDIRSAKPVGSSENRVSKGDQEGRSFVDAERNFSIISGKTSLVRDEHKNEIGVGDLIAARIRGPRNEEEKRALDTSMDASGGISTNVSRGFWDRTRKQSALFRAGAQAVDYERSEAGIQKIPIISGLPTVAWKSENSEGTFSDPTFTNHALDFETLFGTFQVSNEAVQDGGDLLGRMIEQSMANAFAHEIDRSGLVGSGTPPEPLGLFGTSGVNEFEMATNGADLEDYGPLVGAVRMLLDDGLALNEVGPFVMAPRSWQDLNLLATATELAPLPLPRGIADIPWIVGNNIPINQTKGSANDATTIFCGDWTKFIVAFRLSLKIKFFDAPLAKSFATLVQAAARVDFAVQNPAHFVKITGITPGAQPT